MGQTRDQVQAYSRLTYEQRQALAERDFDARLARVEARLVEEGLPTTVISRFRTAAQQAKLHEIGRIRQLWRSPVTNADGLKRRSKHQSNIAVDLAFTEGLMPGGSKADHQVIARIAKEEGLTWGGDWLRAGETRDTPTDLYDPLHVEGLPAVDPVALRPRVGHTRADEFDTGVTPPWVPIDSEGRPITPPPAAAPPLPPMTPARSSRPSARDAAALAVQPGVTPPPRVAPPPGGYNQRERVAEPTRPPFVPTPLEDFEQPGYRSPQAPPPRPPVVSPNPRTMVSAGDEPMVTPPPQVVPPPAAMAKGLTPRTPPSAYEAEREFSAASGQDVSALATTRRYNELAEATRKAYPGQFSRYTDEELSHAVKQAYPTQFPEFDDPGAGLELLPDQGIPPPFPMPPGRDIELGRQMMDLPEGRAEVHTAVPGTPNAKPVEMLVPRQTPQGTQMVSPGMRDMPQTPTHTFLGTEAYQPSGGPLSEAIMPFTKKWGGDNVHLLGMGYLAQQGVRGLDAVTGYPVQVSDPMWALNAGSRFTTGYARSKWNQGMQPGFSDLNHLVAGVEEATRGTLDAGIMAEQALQPTADRTAEWLATMGLYDQATIAKLYPQGVNAAVTALTDPTSYSYGLSKEVVKFPKYLAGFINGKNAAAKVLREAAEHAAVAEQVARVIPWSPYNVSPISVVKQGIATTKPLQLAPPPRFPIEPGHYPLPSEMAGIPPDLPPNRLLPGPVIYGRAPGATDPLLGSPAGDQLVRRPNPMGDPLGTEYTDELVQPGDEALDQFEQGLGDELEGQVPGPPRLRGEAGLRLSPPPRVVAPAVEKGGPKQLRLSRKRPGPPPDALSAGEPLRSPLSAPLSGGVGQEVLPGIRATESGGGLFGEEAIERAKAVAPPRPDVPLGDYEKAVPGSPHDFWELHDAAVADGFAGTPDEFAELYWNARKQAKEWGRLRLIEDAEVRQEAGGDSVQRAHTFLKWIEDKGGLALDPQHWEWVRRMKGKGVKSMGDKDASKWFTGPNAGDLQRLWEAADNIMDRKGIYRFNKLGQRLFPKLPDIGYLAGYKILHRTRNMGVNVREFIERHGDVLANPLVKGNDVGQPEGIHDDFWSLADAITNAAQTIRTKGRVKFDFSPEAMEAAGRDQMRMFAGGDWWKPVPNNRIDDLGETIPFDVEEGAFSADDAAQAAADAEGVEQIGPPDMSGPLRRREYGVDPRLGQAPLELDPGATHSPRYNWKAKREEFFKSDEGSYGLPEGEEWDAFKSGLSKQAQKVKAIIERAADISRTSWDTGARLTDDLAEELAQLGEDTTRESQALRDGILEGGLARDPATRVKQLELLSTDEAMGLRFDDSEQSHWGRPDEESSTICTHCAERVLSFLPERPNTIIAGWEDGTNPGSRVARNSGHDFAIYDGRYLIDPWAKHVEGTAPRAAFDLQNPMDAAAVKQLYGDPRVWTMVKENDEPVPSYLMDLVEQGDTYKDVPDYRRPSTRDPRTLVDDPEIAALQMRGHELNEESKGLLRKLNEGRGWTPEEQARFNELGQEFDANHRKWLEAYEAYAAPRRKAALEAADTKVGPPPTAIDEVEEVAEAAAPAPRGLDTTTSLSNKTVKTLRERLAKGIQVHRGVSKHGPRDPGDFGIGEYHSSKAVRAKQYGDVTPVNLRLKNPLILTGEEAYEQLTHAPFNTVDGTAEARKLAATGLTKALQDQGYDGIAIVNKAGDEIEYVKFPTAQAASEVTPPPRAVQERLPGDVGDVQDLEIPTPTEDLPFQLGREVAAPAKPGIQPGLFGEPPIPAKVPKPSKPAKGQPSLFDEFIRSEKGEMDVDRMREIITEIAPQQVGKWLKKFRPVFKDEAWYKKAVALHNAGKPYEAHREIRAAQKDLAKRASGTTARAFGGERAEAKRQAAALREEAKKVTDSPDPPWAHPEVRQEKVVPKAYEKAVEDDPSLLANAPDLLRPPRTGPAPDLKYVDMQLGTQIAGQILDDATATGILDNLPQAYSLKTGKPWRQDNKLRLFSQIADRLMREGNSTAETREALRIMKGSEVAPLEQVIRWWKNKYSAHGRGLGELGIWQKQRMKEGQITKDWIEPKFEEGLEDLTQMADDMDTARRTAKQLGLSDSEIETLGKKRNLRGRFVKEETGAVSFGHAVPSNEHLMQDVLWGKKGGTGRYSQGEVKGVGNAVENMTRAIMVSQLPTAERNLWTGVGRYTVGAIDDLYSSLVATMRGDPEMARTYWARAKRLTEGLVRPGGTAVKPWTDSMEAIYGFNADSMTDKAGWLRRKMGLGDRALSRRDVRRSLAILEKMGRNPNIKHSAAIDFLGDVGGEAWAKAIAAQPTSRLGKLGKKLLSPEVRNYILTANRFQEYTIRSRVFDAAFRSQLDSAGFNSSELLMKDFADVVVEVGPEKLDDMLRSSTYLSLDFTFAAGAYPDSIPDKLLQIMAQHWYTRVPYPFPRFNFADAPRFIYDHSFAALLEVPMTAAYKLGLTKGTPYGRLAKGLAAENIRRHAIPKLGIQQRIAEARLESAFLEYKQRTLQSRDLAKTFRNLERRHKMGKATVSDRSGVPLDQRLTEIGEQLGGLEQAKELGRKKIADARAEWQDIVNTKRQLRSTVDKAKRVGAPTFDQYIARQMTGLNMLGAAWVMRSSPGAEGTEWYEYRVQMPQAMGGRTVNLDFRAFAPFAQYLFVADTLEDLRKHVDWDQVTNILNNTDPDNDREYDKLNPWDMNQAIRQSYDGPRPMAEWSKDFVEAFLSISRTAGATLSLADLITGRQTDEGTLQNFTDYLVGSVGQFLGRVTVPLRQVTDISSLWNEDADVARIPETTTWGRLAGPTISNIPYLRETIAPKISATTGEPIGTLYPPLRTLTGVTMRVRRPLEVEMKKLGLKFSDATPKQTGNRELDNHMARAYARILNEVMPDLMADPDIQALPLSLRKKAYKKVFNKIKRGAKGAVLDQLSQGMTDEQLEKLETELLPAGEMRQRQFMMRTLRKMDAEDEAKEREARAAGAASVTPPPQVVDPDETGIDELEPDDVPRLPEGIQP